MNAGCRHDGTRVFEILTSMLQCRSYKLIFSLYGKIKICSGIRDEALKNRCCDLSSN
jgi:hypothetical protein